jgi:hypothetical protein
MFFSVCQIRDLSAFFLALFIDELFLFQRYCPLRALATMTASWSATITASWSATPRVVPLGTAKFAPMVDLPCLSLRPYIGGRISHPH